LHLSALLKIEIFVKIDIFVSTILIFPFLEEKSEIKRKIRKKEFKINL